MDKEQKLIESMTSILQEKMEKDYAKGQIKRDAHPKDLGLLKGTFKIEEHIPDTLAKGIFKSKNEYNCFIRLSNASGKIQSDKEKDFRGFAIKLIDVEGEHLNEKEKNTQDFILMSYPIMPLGTVALFHDAVYYSIKSNPLLLLAKFILTGHKSILSHLKKGKKNHTSSLDIRYWSTTPYQFDGTFAKYSLKPTSIYKSLLPELLTDNYLFENNANHLKEAEATFDFCIQLFENELNTPIEDAGIEWDEVKYPFIKVATLTIAKQNIITKNRKELAERLSFSPANTLKTHQPVGGINRARIKIYEQLSLFRNKMNNLESIVPNSKLFEETQ
jgi:Catalase